MDFLSHILGPRNSTYTPGNMVLSTNVKPRCSTCTLSMKPKCSTLSMKLPKMAYNTFIKSNLQQFIQCQEKWLWQQTAKDLEKWNGYTVCSVLPNNCSSEATELQDRICS